MTRQEVLDLLRYKKGVTPYKGLEKNFQKAAAELLDLKNINFFHVPNESAYNKGKQKQGVKKGVSDIIILQPSYRKDENFAGAVLELKVGDKTPRDEQLEFMLKCRKNHYLAFWMKSVDELEDFLKIYYP